VSAERTGALVLQSPKLGPVPYDVDDVIDFVDGLPGFEHLHRFLLVTRDECAPFIFLTSMNEPDVALPLLPLALAAGSMAPELEAMASAALGEERGFVAAYAVVRIGRDAHDIAMNLRAPVVVDLDARRGLQVILSDDRLPVAAGLER
jgi:flagellar assembly factor FliW